MTERLAVIFLFASVVVNIMLTVQLHQRPVVDSDTPTPGNSVPPIELRASVGPPRKALQYGDNQPPTFLYWFSTSCGWCEVNLPNFQALADQSVGKYRFVPVSLEPPGELAAYSEAHHLHFPLYNITAETAKEYHLTGTPLSVLISGHGVIIQRWPGAYSPSVLVDVERMLSIRLPGMSMNSVGGARP